MNTKWEKIKEEKCKAGFRKIVKRTYKLPTGEIAGYDIVESGPAVCVLPITTEGKILMIRVFRPGPDKILTELPGGFNEKKLSPEEAIKKELLEETGYTGDFKLIGKTYEDAYWTMYRHHFVATNCIKVQEPEQEFDEKGSEIILLSIDEFKKHLKSGELTDPETGYMGLLELGLLP
jgi:ADP-ribose pyrophosphatase